MNCKFKIPEMFNKEFILKGDRLSSISIFLLIMAISLSVTGQSHPIPAFLKGNLLESNSGKWVYGFYDKFAMVNGEYWSYKSITKNTTGEYNLILIKKQASPLLLKIKKGHSNLQDSMIGWRTFVNNHDSLLIIDNNNQSLDKERKDTFTIKGIVKNYTTNRKTTLGILSCDLLMNKVQHLIECDSLGRFEVSLYMPITQKIHLEFENIDVDFIGQPTSRLYCYIQQKNDQTNVLFGGSLALLNQEYYSYNRHYEKKFDRTHLFILQKDSLFNQHKYFESVDSFFRQTDKFNDSFFVAQHFTDLTRAVIQNEKLYDRALFAYPPQHLTVQDSVNYKKDVKNLTFLLKEIPSPEYLSASYYYYITTEIKRKAEAQKKYPDLSILIDSITKESIDMRFTASFLLKDSSFLFSVSEKSVLDSLIKSSSPHDFIDSTPRGILWNNIYRLHKQSFDIAANSLYTNKLDSIVTEAITSQCNSILNSNDFSDWSKDLYIYFQIEQYPQIENALAKKLLPSVKNKLMQKVISETVNGSINESFDIKTLALYRKYFGKFKGNVIYVDFWATYCSPCWKEKKYSDSITTFFKGQDVAFLFFCIDDSFEKWNAQKGMFADSKNHFFLEQDEAILMKSLFNISAIPHYVIIDKTGTIREADATRPSLQENLKKMILKYL